MELMVLPVSEIDHRCFEFETDHDVIWPFEVAKISWSTFEGFQRAERIGESDIWNLVIIREREAFLTNA